MTCITGHKLCTFFGLLMVIFSVKSYSQYSIDSRIRASSIVIQTQFGTGSGFFLEDTATNVLYVVTASHVIVPNNNPASLLPDTLLITGYRDNVDVDSTFMFFVSLKKAISAGDFTVDLKNDVAVIRFAKIVNMGTYGAVNYPSFVTKLTRDTKISSWPADMSISIEDIVPGSDLFVIGFPQSLGLQGKFDMNRPLMRKGIVAGKDLKLNKIIGDGAVYFGNSGGIAVALHFSSNNFTLRLAGLVSEFIPFDESLFDRRGNQRSIDYRNSGYSVIIPTNIIFRLIKTFK